MAVGVGYYLIHYYQEHIKTDD